MFIGLGSICFIGGFTYYWSLTGTTVPTNTVLFQFNCCFVFLISVCALGERITAPKVGAVLMCSCGTALVILSGRTGANNGKDTVVGIAMTLISTIAYALYECSYEMFTEFIHTHGIKSNPIDPALFLVFIGVFTLVAVWPALIIAHVTGVEKFELPPTIEVWVGIMQNALLETMFNTFLIVGIADSSAIIMSTGTQFTVPVAYVVDVYRNGYEVTIGAVAGALLLSGGFIMLEFYRSTPILPDEPPAGLAAARAARGAAAGQGVEARPLLVELELGGAGGKTN
jgi:solute carrier family 35 protein F5